MGVIHDDTSFRRSFTVTFVFLVTAIFFVVIGIADYTGVLFILFPIVLGISIGALPSRKFAYYGGAMALIIFLILLVIGHIEGFVCILLVLPIFVPLIFLGTAISYLAKRYKKLKSTDKLSILLLPLIPFMLGATVEKLANNTKTNIVEVDTERVYSYSNSEVYDAIKSVDTLIAEKSTLMKLGLPIPNKCILEEEAIGGLRICYFSGGTITERITELRKDSILRMDVIDYELTGRKWLGFKEAIYYFEKLDENSCKLTRITTYTSKLKPRVYWEPFEKMGIIQEHNYVLDNLERDLKIEHL